MRLASPLHLHISLSASYTTSIAIRPPCTGECRFVRVIRVLDASQTRTCVAFVLRARDTSHHGESAKSS
jgi:hypothetical protein